MHQENTVYCVMCAITFDLTGLFARGEATLAQIRVDEIVRLHWQTKMGTLARRTF
jgi:hypothetical protein